MIRYLTKKIIILLFSLFVVMTATFFLMHAVPGDPFTQEEALSEEVLKAVYSHYGLDKPLHIQYAKYLYGIFHLDLGPSLKYPGRTVNQIIAEGFPVSFMLGLESLCLAVVGGITLGALSAWYHLRWQGYGTCFAALLGVSIPSFLLGSFLQYLLAMKLDLFPVARWGTFSHTILPAFTLAAFPLALIARLTRTSMVEVLHQDYILTARAKGLNAFHIFWRHVSCNALLPVVTYLGPVTASVLTGSFVIEKIFAIPGLGQWVVSSISNRDYTMIMGITIFYSALLMLCVFLVDLACCFMDPRIKKSYEIV